MAEMFLDWNESAPTLPFWVIPIDLLSSKTVSSQKGKQRRRNSAQLIKVE